jgi:hypothetical protein
LTPEPLAALGLTYRWKVPELVLILLGAAAGLVITALR